jgi:hypothetical protein
MDDIFIRGAQVIDGSGASGRFAEVARECRGMNIKSSRAPNR